jgi:mannose-6-phosphate isomerase-like protein (cupin superfamily)
MTEKVNLAEKLAGFDEYFSPKIVAYYNDSKVQVAKVKGDFVWHSHPDTDDFILVLQGHLTVETREGAVELGEGEMVVVPRGVEHRTRAEDETHTLLVESKGTPNTGDSEAEPAPEVEI